MNAPVNRQRLSCLPIPGRSAWAFAPVGDVMQRISLAWFTNLGAALLPLSNTFPGGEVEITTFDLFRVREFLTMLSDEKMYPIDLRASRPVIRDLLIQVNYVLNEIDVNRQKSKLEEVKFNVWSFASRLQTLLEGELAVQPVYHVWPKRAYNIEVLVTEGERLFSLAVIAELNDEEKHNIKEAGKCLAFEVPTAAAFHVFRCAESVLRRYYELVIGHLPKPKMRNWGMYIRNLRKCGADQTVITILEQIKDLHRNPVIHPEKAMENEEALSLIGIIDSALNAMVADMRKRREETSPSLPMNLTALSDAFRMSSSDEQ